MKLAHIAQVLTLALVIATAWLALEAQRESTKANDRIDKLTQNHRATVAAQAEAQAASSLIPGLVTPMSSPTQPSSLPPLPEIKPSVAAAPSPATKPAAPAALASATDIVPPPLPGPIPLPGSAKKPEPPAAPSPVSKPSVATAPSTTPAPAATTSAGGPAPSMASVPTQPLMTPLQRRIKDSPSVAKVKEAVADQGFVTLDAGSKAGLKEGLKFDLRRDSSVVGRITLTIVEEGESVADVDPKSIPEGVKVQPGDELISVVLDR